MIAQRSTDNVGTRSKKQVPLDKSLAILCVLHVQFSSFKRYDSGLSILGSINWVRILEVTKLINKYQKIVESCRESLAREQILHLFWGS